MNQEEINKNILDLIKRFRKDLAAVVNPYDFTDDLTLFINIALAVPAIISASIICQLAETFEVKTSFLEATFDAKLAKAIMLRGIPDDYLDKTGD